MSDRGKEFYEMTALVDAGLYAIAEAVTNANEQTGSHVYRDQFIEELGKLWDRDNKPGK